MSYLSEGNGEPAGGWGSRTGLFVTNRWRSGNARSHLRYSWGHVPVENFCHNHCSFKRRILKALLVYISLGIPPFSSAHNRLFSVCFYPHACSIKLLLSTYPFRLINIDFNSIEVFFFSKGYDNRDVYKVDRRCKFSTGFSLWWKFHWLPLFLVELHKSSLQESKISEKSPATSDSSGYDKNAIHL